MIVMNEQHKKALHEGRDRYWAQYRADKSTKHGLTSKKRSDEQRKRISEGMKRSHALRNETNEKVSEVQKLFEKRFGFVPTADQLNKFLLNRAETLLSVSQDLN